MTILFIGAHPDDVELGAGGTIRRLVDEGHKVHALVLSRGGRRDYLTEEEWRQAKPMGGNCIWLPPTPAQLLARACEKSAAILDMILHKYDHYGGDLDLPDNQFDIIGVLNITKQIERFIESVEPEVVYTHAAADLNIDHRLTHQAVLTACRPLPGATVKEIYAFEVLSSTEWGTGFHPNLYVPLTEAQLQAKLDALACYATEMREFPHPRSPEAIRVLAALRGSQCGHARAEAFEVIRIVRG
jgi:LmbE family N-acetylglucosaminyl deacetylase